MNPKIHNSTEEISKCVRIKTEDGFFLLADLQIPQSANALVIFATDGRCMNNPRNRHIARVIRESGIGTLLCDLLTDEESGKDEESGGYRHDAQMLGKRLVSVTKWLATEPDAKPLHIGIFGACAGSAAALIAAAKMPSKISAVVSRGGRLDLATKSLTRVKCPTLLIVGENDHVGIELNQEALPHMACKKELRIIHGASHLFGEPGKLEDIAKLSAAWLHEQFKNYS